MRWMILPLALFVAACAQPAPRAPAAPASTPGAPASVSVSGFQNLRWVAGRWRGMQPNGRPFFERYRFENDSTIRSYTYADSTATLPADSGEIVLRAGQVTTGSGGARWVADEITATRVSFVPLRGASNSFVWERTSPDSWTATLRTPATADRPAREVVYPMTRLEP
jgi:hypothetical protein